MKKYILIPLIIIIFSFLISFYSYPYMPDEVASHWNIKGEVDDYMPKQVSIFLMPGISIVMLLLMVFLPKISSFKLNLKQFEGIYHNLIIMIMLFLLYIHGITTLWNMDYKFNMTTVIIPALAMLFYYIGSILGKVKRNAFVGIRTPWTLKSDYVWKKTHELGGRLFRIAAVIIILGLVFPDYSFQLLLFPIIGFVIFLLFYSYYLSRKESKN